jgi:hypothetical protein
MVADFMSLHVYFKHSTFDVVIEKAGLDSIATKETEDVPLSLRLVLNQIYSVLKRGGHLLTVSVKNFGKI